MSTKEKITESNKKVITRHFKKLILIGIVAIFLSLIIMYILGRLLGLFNEKELLGFIIGLGFVAFYIGFELYKIRTDVKAGIKVVESALVISIESNLLLTFFLLNNGLRIYSDDIKRGNLRKNDIAMGTKLTLHYIPKSKFILEVIKLD